MSRAGDFTVSVILSLFVTLIILVIVLKLTRDSGLAIGDLQSAASSFSSGKKGLAKTWSLSQSIFSPTGSMLRLEDISRCNKIRMNPELRRNLVFKNSGHKNYDWCNCCVEMKRHLHMNFKSMTQKEVHQNIQPQRTLVNLEELESSLAKQGAACQSSEIMSHLCH